MSGERIAVLAGGRSPEREVSLRSGHRVMTALVSRGYDAFVIDPAESALVATLSTATVSACYIALHGKEGEDGTVQRLLELLGLRYTGTRPLACEMTFDKVLAKESLDAARVPTPSWAVIEAPALRDLGAGAILHRLAERVGLPAVVKPSRAGSAMGLTFVEAEADLPHAVMSALSFADSAVVERRIDGVEIAASMVGAPDDLLPSSRCPRSRACTTTRPGTRLVPPSTTRPPGSHPRSQTGATTLRHKSFELSDSAISLAPT